MVTNHSLNVPLSMYWKYQQGDVPCFLSIAVSITESLMDMHQGDTIHRRLSLEKILVHVEDINKASSQENATRISLIMDQDEGSAAANDTERLIWAYRAPEQTGRLQRDTDARTDLYALGIIFYELLVGEHPYHAEEPAEWIYAHLAKQPPHPREINNRIPQVIGDIILKLMAKAPEERYQSAYGLLHDLKSCGTKWQRDGFLEAFTLGQKDFVSQLRMPIVLSGRGKEMAGLTESFADCLNGKTNIVVISGGAGSGKTTLIREWYRSQQQERGYFISGKADQLIREVPYAPLIQAFQELIHRLLSGSAEQLSRWKAKLILTLGDHAGMMAEMIPDLSLIIGKQAPAETLPWTESRNRLHFAFQAMIHTFAGKRTPFVLFLDDVHWADAATLDFIRSLAESRVLSYFLCILACRDNELPAEHQLDPLHWNEGVHKHIVLPSFTLSETEQFLGEMLSLEALRSRSLAESIFQKTAGNPLYMKQFLQSLFENKWLRFDTHDESWQWDTEQIRKQETLGNVHNFMLDKLERLPQSTGFVLRRAACIGYSFDLYTLAATCQDTAERVLVHMEAALRDGIILPVRERESWQALPKAVDSTKPGSIVPNTWFEFIHDTVQQVAYGAMLDQEKERVHAEIGRYKRRDQIADKLDEQLYTTLYHLMLGVNQLTDRVEKLNIAEMALEASRKARKSGAYMSSAAYLTFGTALLTEMDWEEHHAFMYEMHLERMQVEVICGHLETGEKLFEQLVAHAHNSLEELRIYAVKLEVDINRGNAKEAFHTGLQFLGKLGVELPSEVGLERRQKELRQIRNLLREGLENELQLERSNEATPDQLAMTQLLSIVARASSFVDMNVFVVIICRSIRFMLAHHAVNQFPEIIAIFASYVSSEEGWHNEGVKLSEAALQLGEESLSPVKAKLSFIYALTHTWQLSAQETWPLFKEAHRLSLASGDMYYAGFSLRGMIFSLYFGGSVDELFEFCQVQGGVFHEKDPFILKSFTLYQQFATCLKGETTSRFSMNDGTFDEEAFLHEMNPVEKRIGLVFEYHICKIQLLYLFGRYDEAAMLWERTENSERYYKYHSHLPEGMLYACLALTAVYSTLSQSEQVLADRKLQSMLRSMRTWSERGPAHFLPKYWLMKGESARIRGKWEQALTCYDEAIELATKNGYKQFEAIACELAGKLLFERGKKKFAKTYLMDAQQAYKMWGAKEKCLQLNEQYAELLLLSNDYGKVWDQDLKIARRSTEVDHSETNEGPPVELDRDMFKKAAARLTQTEGFEQLIGHYLVTLMENAGAARGFWIVNKAGDLWIEAEYDINRKVSKSGHSASLESCFDLPISVVRFVARTQQPLVLDDAHLDDLFAWDPYIRSVRPRSIICLPVQQLDQLAGIVYLENEAVTGGLASQRMELMQLMSAQLAVLNRFASEPPSGKPAYTVMDTGKPKLDASMLIQSLTEREKDVMQLMVKGLSNPEIAQRLELAVGTVKNITLAIYGKLQVNRRTQAVAKAKDWNIWE